MMTALKQLMDTILEFGDEDDFGFYELPIYDNIKVKKYEDTVRMIHPEENGGMVFIISEKGIFVPGGTQVGAEKKVENVCNGIFAYWDSKCNLEVYKAEGEELTKVNKVFPYDSAIIKYVMTSDDEVYSIKKASKVLHMFHTHSQYGSDSDTYLYLENIEESPFEDDVTKELLTTGKWEGMYEALEGEKPEKCLITYKALTRKTIFS